MFPLLISRVHKDINNQDLLILYISLHPLCKKDVTFTIQES